MKDIQPDFLDLNWKKPNFEKHLEICEMVKPKYVVAPDILELSNVDTVLKHAEELQQHAENVIVVPKVDCVSSIPEQYAIGYSVPSKYGGCPFPEWYFEGRKIHLLGGSPTKQKNLLNHGFWNVISIDGNGWTLALNYGDIINTQGKRQKFGHFGMEYDERMKYSLINLALYWELKK
jgi:hypothetical protein